MDNLTTEQRRKNMQNIRSENTQPELKIMKELEKREFNFIKYDKSLIGKPDIVFPDKKVVIFIDSDFWHGNRKRFIMPKTNTEYWKNKIERNKKRDKEVNRKLKKEGWKVIRVWEYNIKNNLAKSFNKIERAID